MTEPTLLPERRLERHYLTLDYRVSGMGTARTKVGKMLFEPQTLKIEFSKHADNPWTWDRATLSGPNIKTNGTYGELKKSNIWRSYQRLELPDWLLKMVEQTVDEQNAQEVQQ